jgi:Protein of unknown function (DUF1592)/Protein of unknown function (DUF1588)/Protein of unknown function (DUF1587)/Protein of unknown function (DUF1595)/Ca-dependent carbohydrate-binding module xylan-binding/Protein of unknown function (DUF1585)
MLKSLFPLNWKKNKNRYSDNLLFLIVFVFLIISGCGGGGGSDSKPQPTPVDTTSSGNSSVDSTVLNQGFNFYKTQCVSCHEQSGATAYNGQGTFTINASKFSSNQTLANYIAANMPINNIGDCINECATSIAAFIRNGFSTDISNPTPINSSSAISSFSNTPPAPQGQKKLSAVKAHRLNRSEYNNTVKDLLGTRLRPADTFPEDDFGYGFNNNAEVLSVSFAHIEQYEQAAESLVDEAFGKTNTQLSLQFSVADYGGGNGVDVEGLWLQYSNGAVNIPIEVNYTNRYRLSIVAGQDTAGTDAANMRVLVNGSQISDVAVTAARTNMQTYTLEISLLAGLNNVQLMFTNDYYEDPNDRNLWLSLLSVDGPLDAVASNGIISEFQCDPNLADLDCAKDIAQNFGARAWRRPMTASEVDQLLVIYDAIKNQNASHQDGLMSMIKAILLSPHFIYRLEIDADLTATQSRPLTAYELASRLSYFLWSSMPDDELFQLAANDTLLNTDVLRAQVKRMLNHEKSASLIENFAVQWLKFDKVAETNPDLAQFPQMSPSLINAMRQETRLFLRDIFNNNQSVNQLFTANYTYLNQPLAQHYGVSLQGNDFQRYQWTTGDARPGLLGQASILTATSHPASTSPVLRGKWVLQNLLCDEPPPPPPGVENVADNSDISQLPTRKRFEAHSRSGSSCFACHQTMDPIGFGLENFNPVGQWRTLDAGVAVDASGQLPSGQTFNGPLGLSNILAESYKLPMCTTEHLMAYALGRGVDGLGYGGEKPDYANVYDVYQKTLAGGHKIRDIIEEIVVSDVFRQRLGADAAVGVNP